MKFIKKNHILIILIIFLMIGCAEGYLNYEPKGTISNEQLNTPERIDKLLTAAYSSLGNGGWLATQYASMWSWGSVRSDNAYKGGGGVPDQGEWNAYEQFSIVRTDMGKANTFWEGVYSEISRANDVLRRLENFTEEEYPKKTHREAEARFLRGHFHFLGKIMFKHIPFATHTVPQDSLANISNRQYTSQELWNKIAEDFQFAANNLPESYPDQPGRIDRYEAKAYLAKIRLYQAYEQNDQHDVTNINQNRLQEVVQLTNDVINSGKYELYDDYAKNFLWEFESGKESVFSVRFSIDDGSPTGRINIEYGLNYNMAADYGCCWFHTPSQNLVNAYKTNSDGLPMFDSFNESSLNAQEPEDFQNNTVDPRIDHTVGIPGHPFKYDPEFVYQDAWARAPGVYGWFSTMKETQHPDCPCFKRTGPFYASSADIDVIRYADVLLWKAEALIELGRHDEALPIINQIRQRAANSTTRLENANGNPPSNYEVETYQPGTNINWTQENARKALRWERRLEFAMEGYRFFDLVRWGIAAETINEYLATEKQRRSFLNAAQFKEGRDEYLPIPQQQIDFSEGLYEQNTGW